LAEKELEHEMVQSLEVEKQALEAKLAGLQEETAAQVRKYEEDFKFLKAKVTNVLTRLMSKAISEQEAIAELQELGCKVEMEKVSADSRSGLA
jgi:Na+/phosphate symporter